MFVLMMQNMNAYPLDSYLVSEYRIIILGFVFLELVDDELKVI